MPYSILNQVHILVAHRRTYEMLGGISSQENT
jgi:hypothetical protein